MISTLSLPPSFAPRVFISAIESTLQAPFGGKEGENEMSDGDLSKAQSLTDSASLTPVSAAISSAFICKGSCSNHPPGMSSTTQSPENSAQPSPAPNDENINGKSLKCSIFSLFITESVNSSASPTQQNSSNDSIDPFATIQQAIEGLSMKDDAATTCEVVQNVVKESEVPAVEERSSIFFFKHKLFFSLSEIKVEQKEVTEEEDGVKEIVMNATHTIQQDSEPSDQTFTAECVSVHAHLYIMAHCLPFTLSQLALCIEVTCCGEWHGLSSRQTVTWHS